MARQPRHRSIRNLKSSGWELARFTVRTLDKAASGLFRWAATDHSGMGKKLQLMPQRGFLDSLLDILVCFLLAVFGAVLQGVWIYLLIAYGIPFLIYGHF